MCMRLSLSVLVNRQIESSLIQKTKICNEKTLYDV